MTSTLALLLLLGLGTPQAEDGSCQDAGPDIGFLITGTQTGAKNCDMVFYCEPPELGAPVYEIDGICDPMVQSCTVKASVPSVFPGNSNNTFGSASVDVIQWWSPVEGAALRGFCGSFGNKFLSEKGDAFIKIGFSCANPNSSPFAGDYELVAIACFGAGCEVRRTAHVRLRGPDLYSRFCAEPPPEDDCKGAESCELCKDIGGGPGGGGASAAGGGGTAGGPGTGAGAYLRYKAGSIGHPNLPGSGAWSAELGRYWSHDYAERIFEDSNPAPAVSKVYLVTGSAVYQTFSDMAGDGVYEIRKPASVYETLETAPGGGWTLTYLDGMVKTFDADGRWISTADRFGNAKTATYTAARLTQVDFPDGRHEEFAYHPSGKLASLTEVGVDGLTSRVWSYTWTGEDLTRIDMPDGRALEYFYTDGTHPGFMTRTELVGDDGTSRRVTAAWEYDTFGNVIKIWKGDASFAAGVERWQFSFDDPVAPVNTMVTDPLGDTATYQLDTVRSSRTEKAKLIKLNGDCPSCGTGANSQLFYEDSSNPYRVTREKNGRLFETHSTWNSNGQLVERIEAFGTPIERTTAWTYDPNFPQVWNSIEQPSTTGVVTDVRRIERSFDSSGRLLGETIEGIEAASPFSLTTSYTPTPEGLTGTVDPPGYGTSDQTSFTYDPARGNLVQLTRTDPLIGTTSYGYDAFNRRTSMTDVNGVVTETTYDDLNRVLTVTDKGATLAEDRVTESRYDTLGDLFQTVLPEGNVIEYGYDAAGRLTSVERKPDDEPTSHGERTFYTLNGAGQRTLEERQSWNGAWVTVTQTAWQFSTRCHLDKTTEGLPGEQSVTEQAYDCDGNVSKVWDANHPSAGQTATASTSYTYDQLDRLTRVRQPFGGAGGGNVDTNYTYDVQDHLSSVTDANGTLTSYIYSDRDLMTREVSEVSGATNYNFNEHGQLTIQLDARSILTTRVVDELDRVTAIHLPDSSLDVSFTYGDPLVPFSKGRLTRISRGGTSIAYLYDRFGRTIADGDILYTFDKNSRAATMTYPGGLVATYTHDYADRPQTLSVTPAGGTPQAIVTAASHRPSGPISSLTLGNGITETRDFDSREYPKRIFVPGKIDWNYTLDGVGNPTVIADALVPANNKTYTYQNYQYFLTTGNGPWGTRAWTYDKIGNRLTENRSGVTDTYTYIPNAATGRSPKIQQIAVGGGGGTSLFSYDSAGNETQAGTSARTFDDAGRLSELTSSPASSSFLYDGRGFLAEAAGEAPASGGSGIFCDGFESGNISQWGSGPGSSCFERIVTHPTYGSEGRLYGVQRGGNRESVLYFEDRPVATLGEGLAGNTYRFLTTDQLGTPVLASDDTGTLLWGGGFEPFGRDWNGAQATGVFLRFPGQWEDAAWQAENQISYNVNRWYVPQFGRYSEADPAGLLRSNLMLFSYAGSTPTRMIDPFGLTTCVMISAANVGELGGYELRFGNHSAFFVGGKCKGSEEKSCGSPGPFLYDPAGGYSAKYKASGSSGILHSEIDGWSLSGFFDYQCSSESDVLEIYCFETTCCEEQELTKKAIPGMGVPQCAIGVGSSLQGTGPFADLGGTTTPAMLRNAMNGLLKKHSGSGAFSWTHRCKR